MPNGKLWIKRGVKPSLFSAARPRVGRADFVLFVYFAHFLIRFIVQYSNLHSPVSCGILSLSRGGNTSGVGKPTLGVELLAEAVYDPTFRHATFLKIISRNPLTNRPSCDTIRVQKGRARRPRERMPTRASKTSAPRSDRMVCRYAGYKCEPDPTG